MESFWSDPSLVGSLITGFVAVAIAVGNGIWDTKRRRADRLEAEAAHSKATAALVLVSSFVMPTMEPARNTWAIQVRNIGEVPVLSVDVQVKTAGHQVLGPIIDATFPNGMTLPIVDECAAAKSPMKILRPGSDVRFATDVPGLSAGVDYVVRFQLPSGHRFVNRGDGPRLVDTHSGLFT